MGRILTPALLAKRMHDAQSRHETPPDYFDDDAPTLDALTDEVIEVIGRACRATDPKAQADLLREAASMLETLACEVAQ